MLRPRGSHHQRNRVGGADQEGSVQNREVRESESDDVGTVECGDCCLTPFADLNSAKPSPLYYLRPVCTRADSTGQTIAFLLSAKRDTAAAKLFFHKALSSPGNPVPRVINVDKNPAYPAAVERLKAERVLPRRVRLRQCKYLNNVVEQDHRTVKKRVWLAKGYGSFQSAWRTLQGIEAVAMIRKGRVRWLAKGDAMGQAHFIAELFGLAA